MLQVTGNDKHLVEAFKNINLNDHPSLRDALDQRISTATLNCDRYLNKFQPLALISGAGLAGLAASFELRARGFKVVIAEKRDNFSRFNIINLNVETQVFLKKFNLLEKFEEVAARIKEHRYVLISKMKETQKLDVSDVSKLQLEQSVCFEPESFDKLFCKDGIYSAPIKTLQTFLVENALEVGVQVLGNTKIEVLPSKDKTQVSKVRITGDLTLKPDLFFIAEGAHSTTASQLGIKTKEVINACSDENWIFGNMTYPGEESFVISQIDASEKNVQIANVIFNATSHEVNIAVNSEKRANKQSIQKQIFRTAKQVFTQKVFPLEEMKSKLLTTVDKPVHIKNRISDPFSKGTTFCIGDAAGASSPLAGLGGTLALTLVPLTVSQLLDDYEQQSEHLHENFNKFSEAYTKRWIQKSEGIKNVCLSFLESNEIHREEEGNGS